LGWSVFQGILCYLHLPSGSEQLQQVADRAHQSPFTADILFAAQAEATEAASFLDLSEDRFDDGVSSRNGQGSIQREFGTELTATIGGPGHFRLQSATPNRCHTWFFANSKGIRLTLFSPSKVHRGN